MNITDTGREKLKRQSVFGLLGGLALFLYGMQMMSVNLETAAGSRMKQILEKLTANRLLGVCVGAGITAVIQSSSATTVMVVGFVNSGLMTLKQAVWIIMGANIGTTITCLLYTSRQVRPGMPGICDRGKGGGIMKKHWYDYLWIFSTAYLLLGFWNILFAWLGLLCFFIPLIMSIAGGGKGYCNRYCGRGQLFSLPVSYTHLDVYKRQPCRSTGTARQLPSAETHFALGAS